MFAAIVTHWVETLPSRAHRMPPLRRSNSPKSLSAILALGSASAWFRIKSRTANNPAKNSDSSGASPYQPEAPVTLSPIRRVALSPYRRFAHRISYFHPKPAITRSANNTTAVKKNSSTASPNGSGKRIQRLLCSAAKRTVSSSPSNRSSASASFKKARRAVKKSMIFSLCKSELTALCWVVLALSGCSVVIMEGW